MDGMIMDIYGVVFFIGCGIVWFSVDYNILIGWEGLGNMEISDECVICNGDFIN